MEQEGRPSVSRRDFMKVASAAALAVGVGTHIIVPGRALAQQKTLKVLHSGITSSRAMTSGSTTSTSKNGVRRRIRTSWSTTSGWPGSIAGQRRKCQRKKGTTCSCSCGRRRCTRSRSSTIATSMKSVNANRQAHLSRHQEYLQSQKPRNFTASLIATSPIPSIIVRTCGTMWASAPTPGTRFWRVVARSNKSTT